jgi:hypothetical protein
MLGALVTGESGVCVWVCDQVKAGAWCACDRGTVGCTCGCVSKHVSMLAEIARSF